MRGARPWPRLSAALGLVAAAGAAFAAEPEPRRPEWGTKDRILKHVGFAEFLPVSSGLPFTVHNGFASGAFGVSSTSDNAAFFATPQIPSGALLTYLELDFCDTDPDDDVILALYDCGFVGNDCQFLQNASSIAALQSCGFESSDLSPLNFTVNNNSRQLLLLASLHGGTEATQFNGAYIGYRLQISPAPATPTFGDVPTTHLYFRAIEALAGSGITSGCGSGNFCPSQNVTRGEMAAFLARALGLHFAN